MNSLCKACLIGGIVLLAASALAPPAQAQLQPQSHVLQLLWPFGRGNLRPTPLLPPEATPAEAEPEPERRPLVAPFIRPTININTCTLAQLQNLPGVNASMAAHILAGRPYRNYADLERDGVPLNVVARLRGKISFGPRPD